MRNKAWSRDEELKLVEMFKEDQFLEDIGSALGRSRRSVEGHLRRHRGRLGLDIRDKSEFMLKAQGHKYKGRKPFEVEWLGSVPLGHWMITKPWSTSGSDA